jgi:predicted enzyme related to lactoylglutathione lyase
MDLDVENLSADLVTGGVRLMGKAAISLVSVMCRDHLRLSDFYQQAFGWPEIDGVGSPIFRALDTGPVAIGFHADDAYDLLGLAEWREGQGTAVHVTLDLGTPAEIDGAVDRLVDLGATVVKGPFTTYYDARQVVLTDPEGNVLRISSHQPTLDRGATASTGETSEERPGS